MPYKYIVRSCGHKEKVWLLDDEVNNPLSLQYHSEEICSKCFQALNRVKEVKMDYKSYKLEFSQCRTKPNSYDPATKEIIVYVPIGRL